MKLYTYSKQKIIKSDLKEVSKTLYYKKLSRGSLVTKFEKEISKQTNSRFTIAVNSGTSAIILAIQSLSLEKNTYIAVPNITFVGTANSVLLSGYKVLLIDVDETTGLVDVNNLKKKIKKKKVSCFINVHLNGNIEDLEKIYKFCKRRNIKIIDDACHALGTTYYVNRNYLKICNNSFCDISTLSFHPTKLITTGEGGALLTNNKNIYKRALSLMNHGYQPNKIKKGKYFHTYYKVFYPGYNFRLSDINCALGYNQIKRIRKKIKHRQKIALFYDNYFKNNKNFSTIPIKKTVKSAYHLYPLQIKNYNEINKIKLMSKLKQKKILTQIHYLPLNNHPLYKSRDKNFPGSQKYFKKSFSIPLHEDITLKDAKKIAKIINEEYSKI